ncbi:uncharacterized protein VTP21DRAFT_3700 [Calcarisporiella thermophila]|uniref:uncharacterized protein n=1 Tax=Calcarisporiella thermophila TaxID=911321 RepID=UPI003742B659
MICDVDSKLIISLIRRVELHLPCNGRSTLEKLVSDQLIEQTVSALMELSHYRLEVIVRNLILLLESISQQFPTNLHDTAQLEVLQSQYFVLNLLAACATSHWKWCSISLNVDASQKQMDFTLPDPPPLDGSLARHVLDVISNFVRLIYPAEDGTNLTTLVNRQYISSSSSSSFAAMDFLTYQTFVITSTNSHCDIISGIYKAASRTLFYLTASNWNIVLARLKARIFQMPSAYDNAELSDMPDFRLLECACLNQERLANLLRESCSFFPHLRRSSQTLLAMVLRRAIWNWIEIFPNEFTTIYRNQQRLEGGPEILFDICSSLADSHRRKTALWPLQTTLLLLCPDIFISALTENAGAHGRDKTSSFLETLKKNRKGSRLSDVSTVCYIDICKASNYVLDCPVATAITNMVKEVEADLCENLFDAKHPFSLYDIGVDQNLMIDCILSLFRLNPRHCLRTIVPICLQDTSPIVFKLTLAKCCLILTESKIHTSIPNYADIISDTIPSQIRKLFMEGMNREKTHHELSLARKVISLSERKQKRLLREEHNIRLELLLTIFKLYRIKPDLVLRVTMADHYFELHQIIKSIAICLYEPVSAIRANAAELLTQLHDENFIEHWGPSETLMSTFWSTGSEVIRTVANAILAESREQDGQVKSLLETLLSLIIKRNNFLRKQTKDVRQASDSPERIGASIALETTLLILLCSRDTTVCSLAATCLGYLCEEATLTEDLVDSQRSQLSIIENFQIYSQLSKKGGLITGRKAQQKKIRKQLCKLKHASPGNLAAWEEAYKRWQVLTQLLTSSAEDTQEDMSYENIGISGTKTKSAFREKFWTARTALASSSKYIDDRVAEWHNYTGFLASLGGCCISSSYPSTIDYNMCSAIENYRENEHDQLVEHFMREMLLLLTSENVLLRGLVLETLSSDLSPSLYTKMFQIIELKILQFFKRYGEPIHTDRSTLFVDQAISILRNILESVQESGFNISMDLGNLLLNFLRYLDQAGQSQEVLRMKIKACQMCELVVSRREYIIFNKPMVLRNKLADIIIEWAREFSEIDFNRQEFSHLDRVYRDLNLACIKAIAILLEKLPLIPDTQEEFNGDSETLKARLFHKHFQLFMKLLQRCRITEAINYRNTTSEDSYILFKDYSRDLISLRDHVILALTHLISSNIEVGFKSSLSLGYHEESNIRFAFMQVFTNMLDSGTEFDTLKINSVSNRMEKYEKLVNMLFENDSQIALALCEVCPVVDIDMLSALLLKVYDSRGKTTQLLRAIVELEVASTESESELFRRNSMATRLLSAFARQHGAEYIRSTLQPLLQELYAKPHQYAFELDPTKVKDEEISQNLAKLKCTTQRFLDVICTSGHKVPPVFRELCFHLSTAVGRRFPEAKYTAVGGFIFLRFFCPAIVAPEVEELVRPAVSKEFRRGLTLITKVIQNLANNVLFGAKEPYMTVLNDFLTSNIYRVTTFLRDISANSPSDMIESQDVNALEEADYLRLQFFLQDNMNSISSYILRESHRSCNSTLTSCEPSDKSLVAEKKNTEKVCEMLSRVLRELGPSKRPPTSMPNEPFAFSTKNYLYHDFMQRNSHRSTLELEKSNALYYGGLSKERYPILVYVIRRINNESIDFELLLYFILKFVLLYADKPFDILFDCVQITRNNFIPYQWLNQFFQYVPYSTVLNVNRAYFFSAGSLLHEYIMGLPRAIPMFFIRRVVFVPSLSELYEYMSPSENPICKKSLEILSEPSKTFSPVYKIVNQVRIPTILRVGNEWIHINSQRKEGPFFGFRAQLVDIYHISMISDVIVSTTSSDENEFFLKCDKKMHYRLLQTNGRKERRLQPSDVRGALLNMAFLNLGNEDPALRLAAYGLLRALSFTFNLDTGGLLISADGLCIPANNSLFLQSVSEQLAKSEPQLTLDFLSEWFVGFTKSQIAHKQLCLSYISPWLSNLGKFINAGRGVQSSDLSSPELNRVREIICQLLEITATQSQIFPTILSRVWCTLSQIEEIIPLILDSCVRYAVKHGAISPQADMMADLIVALSSTILSGKLVSRLRNAITRTSIKPTYLLTEHSAFSEIIVLVRFSLALSFNNQLHVQQHLPELIHIITMLACTGPLMLRSSIHGLLINVTQSLALASHLSDIQKMRLQVVLNEFSDPKQCLLFGLSRITNAFSITQETSSDHMEGMELSSLEVIVQLLTEVIQMGASSTHLANQWRSRWTALVSSTSFQFNPAIQPRAFVVLGILSKGNLDDDLLYQILVTLRGALAMINDADCSLIISILMCLTSTVSSLSPNSRYLPRLFWIVMALLEIGHMPIFTSALNLLHEVVDVLDGHGYFDRGFSEVLLELRQPINDIAADIDSTNGVSFSTHFSFAAGATLLKGLRHPTSKLGTRALLDRFLELEMRNSGADLITTHALAYLMVLIPHTAQSGELEELLQMVGVPLENGMTCSELCLRLFDRLEIPDNTSALLLASMLLVMLNNSENSREKTILFCMLSETASAIPDVFSLIYSALLPRMSHILSENASSELVENAGKIICNIISSVPLPTPGPSDSSSATTVGEVMAVENQESWQGGERGLNLSHVTQMNFLAELGFQGIMDCGSFSNVTKNQVMRNAHMTGELIEDILSST